MTNSTLRARTTIAAVTATALFTSIFLLTGCSPELWVDKPTHKAESMTWRTSVSLAGTAVTFLALTLAIGPVRVLRGGRPAIHLPWRRTFGVSGALLAVFHLLVALNIHGSALRPWHQFFRDGPSLTDPFVALSDTRGLANWIGLAAATTLVCVAMVSRQSWLRRLGAVRWKLAQRATYVAFLAIAVHALLYWRVEERLPLHQFVVLVPIVVVAVLQVAAGLAVVARRRRCR